MGELGSAALCAAAAALTLTPRLLARVAPPHDFGCGYTGAFRLVTGLFPASPSSLTVSLRSFDPLRDRTIVVNSFARRLR